jgi:hypothetical protein
MDGRGRGMMRRWERLVGVLLRRMDQLRRWRVMGEWRGAR